MVTYLAIFVVCDFSYIETQEAIGKVPMRVYGTDQNVPFLKYAARVAPIITNYYQVWSIIRLFYLLLQGGRCLAKKNFGARFSKG